MKVIGTGLPRTGTLSQKLALDRLGFGPTYHMVNVLANLDLVSDWQAALDGNPDWGKIFDGFEAAVDWPAGYFFKELIELHPDAKVVHSVRDTARWEKSMRETVWAVYHGDFLIHHMSSARATVDPGWAAYLRLLKGLLWSESGTLHRGHETPAGLIASFDAHTEAVKRSVPPDQLLIYDITDGWEPLCEFLEVKVPDEPMPRVNEAEEFKRRVVELSLVKLQAWSAENSGPVTGPTPAGPRN